ncbi:MAG: serine hydrolase domain-containing protein [Tepidiformaceae bacterium]
MDYEPLPKEIADLARDELRRLSVPGAAVGVTHNGRVYTGGVGITNVDHPLAVTPETLFQIGSTSKTFSATAAMMLREEGRLDLEAPVRAYLPAFSLQSEEDAGRMTVRHLVTHRGGWSGDFFRDTGRGEDALARIVAKMANSPQIVPAGTAFSYNNAGFYVLGRIIEVLSGMAFESFVRARILEPLGMTMSSYFPEDALIHRVVAGHVVGPEGPRVATPWQVPRSIAPGGGLISNVVDQLRYAQFHLGDGSAPDGTRLLERESMAFMQTPQAAAGSMCEAIGVSWMLDMVAGEAVVKHGGATLGQLSAFELVPGRGYGCTVLTNSDSGRGLRPTVADACLRHFTGLRRELPVEDRSLRPAAELEGTYVATLATLEVRLAEGWLTVREMRTADNRPGQVPEGTPPMPLALIGPDRAAVVEGPRRGEGCEFVRDPGGRVRWLRWDGRLAGRAGE